MQAIEVEVPDAAPSDAAERLLAAAEKTKGEVNCFDFVPSDYRRAWSVLAYLRRRFDQDDRRRGPSGTVADSAMRVLPRFCEWGSGMGVVTGLAALLGYRASGVERDAELANLSRELLASQGIEAAILSQDMFESREQADVYYAYGWAIQRPLIEEHFASIAPSGGFLVLCHGQSDLRIYQNG